MPFKVVGPKGGLILRAVTAAKLARVLPRYVARFGRVTVSRVAAKRTAKKAAKTNVRARIVEWCRWSIKHEPQIHYRQSRPIPLKDGKARKLPLYTDCSGHATIAYYQADAPDPNGNGYDGSGYTGTLKTHGRKVAPREAKPGDLVVFGPGTGHHVCVILEAGIDPLLCSHGQERGPFAIRLSEEQVFQPRPAQFFNYLD